MKNKIKNNILIYFSFIILLVILVVNASSFIKQDIINKERRTSYRESVLLSCENDSQYKITYEKLCKGMKENEQPTSDFYYMLYNINNFGYRFLSFSLFLFILIPAFVYGERNLRNRTIINSYNREGFIKYKKRLFRETYKASLILPLIGVISIIICYIYSGSFVPKLIQDGGFYWKLSEMNKPFIFCVLYVLNIFIRSLLFCNIVLIILKKKYNYFVSIILSFLSIYVIELILEIFVSIVIVQNLLHLEFGLIFNIIDFFSFSSQFGFATCMIVPTLLLIITSLIVKKIYKNKEKFIIDCEKIDRS